jgi:hypothetical protein
MMTGYMSSADTLQVMGIICAFRVLCKAVVMAALLMPSRASSSSIAPPSIISVSFRFDESLPSNMVSVSFCTFSFQLLTISFIAVATAILVPASVFLGMVSTCQWAAREEIKRERAGLAYAL